MSSSSSSYIVFAVDFEHCDVNRITFQLALRHVDEPIFGIYESHAEALNRFREAEENGETELVTCGLGMAMETNAEPEVNLRCVLLSAIYMCKYCH